MPDEIDKLFCCCYHFFRTHAKTISEEILYTKAAGNER